MTATILIIDDNEDDQQLYRRALKNLNGFTLFSAFTATEGLKNALTLNPSIILLDYKLPDMDGLEFLEKLIQVRTNEIPVIMLTGEGNEPVAVEAMKAGASDYIVKDVAGGFIRLLPSVIKHVLAAHADKIEMRRLKDLHQTILHTVADGVIGIGIDGVILFANTSAERMLKCLPNTLVGRQISKLILPEGLPSTWSAHPLALLPRESGSMSRDIDILQSDDGGSFPINYTASRLDSFNADFMGIVIVFQDITERKKAEHKLLRSAHYDLLTGLSNRVMFREYLDKAFARSDRSQRQLTVFFIDLDGFKEVNDTLGHHAGDQLLQMVAIRLEQCVRAGDLVSRIGGDEFTIIVEDSQINQLEILAQKLLDSVEQRYTLLDAHDITISASIGIASYPQVASDWESLIHKADKAMYEIKKRGKRGFGFAL
jgi:diguanylate cyclase (GGDEF)-like protein/PAS domain S-box-containing protein